MDKSSTLLFELSSPDRLDILNLLRKTPMKLSHISSKLNFTVQETSRNVTRLSEAKLISKDVDGTFHLTPFGEESLNLLSGFKFLFKNREYLSTHVLSVLPGQFRAGLGVLDRFDFVNDVMVCFHDVEKMICNAERHVWILTNQVLVSTLPFLVQAVGRGVEFRLLMPKDFVPPQGLPELVRNPAFAAAARENRMDNRFLDRVDLFLCLSEKQVAVLGFPNLEGKIDYIGFKTEDQTGVEWSEELFNYYWSKASKHIPEQLYRK